MLNRFLLAAPVAAVALVGVLAGTALAQDDVAPRPCDVARSELAQAQSASTLPVTIGGQPLTTLAQVQSFYDQAKDLPPLADTAAQLKVVLDAAARVGVLEQELTECVEPGPDPTGEPTPEPTETVEPTAEPTPTTTPGSSESPSSTVAPDVVSGDGGAVADSVPQGSVDTGGW